MKPLPKGLLVIAGVFFSLIVLTAIVEWAVPDAGLSRWKDAAGIVQAVFTALAVVIGLVIAVVKLELFREFQPHLTISHEVSHRSIGDSYIHIAVVATLYNSSKVKVELGEASFLLQQISPVSDDEVEFVYSQAFLEGEYKDFGWPTLENVRFNWDGGGLIVEPGETMQDTFQFIVSEDVESVVIHMFFYSSEGSASSSATGWGATMVQDFGSRG